MAQASGRLPGVQHVQSSMGLRAFSVSPHALMAPTQHLGAVEPHRARLFDIAVGIANARPLEPAKSHIGPLPVEHSIRPLVEGSRRRTLHATG